MFLLYVAVPNRAIQVDVGGQNDDLVKYDQQNIYKRNTENLADSSKWSERKILRNWIRGSRDEFLDIIETK